MQLSSKRNIVFVLLLTFLSFYPVINNSFTNWDDDRYVYENPVIKDSSASNIKKVFTTLIIGHQHYHPLTILTYILEYRFFGLNPRVYHIDNLILHLFNTFLVFCFIYLLCGKELTALITSLFFGIHPLHVESVAWITERQDVLFAFFYLWALIHYILYLRNERKEAVHYSASLVLFLFSALSKPAAVTLPLIFLLVDYYFARKITWKAILEKAPFFALALFFAVVTLMQKHMAYADKESLYSFSRGIFIASHSFLFYLVKLILPFHLSGFYPLAESVNPIEPILAVLILYLAFALLIKKRENSRAVIFGVLFFLSTIILVLGFFPIGKSTVADRYTYVSYVGIFFIIANWLQGILKKKNKIITALFLAVVLVFSLMTYQRCQVWKDSLTFWNDVISKYPKAAIAYLNRGKFNAQGNQIDKALSDFTKAIEIKPYYYKAYNNRGALYILIKRYDLALADLNQAIKLFPYLVQSFVNRARIYIVLGKYNEARADLDYATKLDPNFAPTKYYYSLLK